MRGPPGPPVCSFFVFPSLILSVSVATFGRKNISSSEAQLAFCESFILSKINDYPMLILKKVILCSSPKSLLAPKKAP